MQKILKRVNIQIAFIVSLVFTMIFGTGVFVFASDTSQFSQTINAGTLATDIRSDSTTSVSSPAVTMSAKTFSFDCQSGGSASTGTFGTASERIYVDNPDAADSGWTLTLSTSTTATWTGSGGSFDFNDSSGSGCTDGADSDSYGGQLTVNPAAGSITTDYSGSATTGISLGSSNAFVEGSVNTITVVSASGASPDIWRGYFTGVSLSQTIPAEQAAAAYSIYLVLSVTAL